MSESVNITSVGVDPAADRARRQRFYLLSMAIRFVCVASLFFLPLQLSWFAIVGAVVLPYFAVMIANAVAPTVDDAKFQTVTPAAITPEAPSAPAASTPHTIVVDAFADRKSSGERIYGES
ncbi:DUF3099 domain-containing protein [Canibacter zhoujuaniae]|uniref:DUF3099 domain-containing protein n=1 Tax=Canibacter zhoujuaniae TaxID=2708343 RepID=UPI00142499AD|nr:DUF3099 domain-containing protein [Canibacter zhoujuaniae]